MRMSATVVRQRYELAKARIKQLEDENAALRRRLRRLRRHEETSAERDELLKVRAKLEADAAKTALALAEQKKAHANDKRRLARMRKVEALAKALSAFRAESIKALEEVAHADAE